ncbi:unnamed protein product [Allacma fusca]|uniref:Uncharacterized protein n=1 Tax=Allacma fusca TaxID=39272 RepID=A0A8J2PGZ6_9HEXA|nr:unnamed protein product [Allacma fusca]
MFSNSMEVAETIIQQVGESMVAKKHKRLILECLEKLKGKMLLNYDKKFHTFRMLRTHAMPLTDACLTKDGTKCLTTSYDRTCRIWDLQEGKELITLGDHIDIVCCVSINPTCDRVLTGSYDGTVRLWRVSLDQENPDSECLHILRGADMAEVQVAQFSPDYLLAAAGSSDSTTTIYDLTSGVAMYTLEGHDAEISAAAFDQSCQTLLTGSYDSRLGLWDLRSGNRIAYYKGHEAEVVSCLFNFSCDKIASGSMDSTVRLWDIRKDKSCLSVFIGHAEEVI